MTSPGYHSETDRRQYIRIAYETDRKPALVVNGDRLKVLDLSQTGVRVLKRGNRCLEKSFQARLELLTGEAVAVDAVIEWEENNQLGIRLAPPIPPELFSRERRRHILLMDR